MRRGVLLGACSLWWGGGRPLWWQVAAMACQPCGGGHASKRPETRAQPCSLTALPYPCSACSTHSRWSSASSSAAPTSTVTTWRSS